MYIYMYMFIYICIYIHMYTYINIYVYVSATWSWHVRWHVADTYTYTYKKKLPFSGGYEVWCLKILGFFFPFLLFWFYPCVKTPEKFTDSTPHHKSWIPLSCVIYKLLWLSHVTHCTGTRCNSGLWLLETSAISVLVRAPPESGNEISLSVNDLFFCCHIARYALYTIL